MPIRQRFRSGRAGGSELEAAVRRYRSGEHRSTIFRDLVVRSIETFGTGSSVVLDIGCGRGFDNNAALQESIAAAAGRYIGIEPDPEIPPAPYMDEYYSCTLETAPVTTESVHVAFSTFVLEHVQDPAAFWNKLHEVLVPGGIFWGFTADARHPFALASRLMGWMGAKDAYLDWLKDMPRSSGRYNNYPTFYRANSPRHIAGYASGFARCEFAGFHRVGQLRYYFPYGLKRAADLMDRLTIVAGLASSILAVRIEKKATPDQEPLKTQHGFTSPEFSARSPVAAPASPHAE